MEAPDKKELIDEIAALFKEHEEPYEAGAWEDFSKRSKKKGPIGVIWIGVAAALLVICSVLPFIWKKNSVEQITVGLKKGQTKLPEITLDGNSGSKENHNVEPEKSKSDVLEGNQTGLINQALSFKNKDHQNQIINELISKEAVESKASIAIASDSSSKPFKKTDIASAGLKSQDHVAGNEKAKEKDFMEFLREESSKPATKTAKAKTDSRWDFGVEVSPTLLQSRLNMGAGVTTEYKLSKSFSLSSGVAYVAMAAGKNLTPDFSQASMMSNKKLTSVNSDIRAIDIPISLTFNVNKQLYTSVGVSYFGVISEKRNNKYLTELEVSSTLQDVATGDIKSFQSVLREKNNEVVTETPLNGNSYLGFFNFSVGRKQEIFNKYNIVVEPFLKIPVGKLSNQDLKLTNGGVRLKLTF
ncbi:hypothetical protein DBR11_24590 [Pedobacter sp. HMWF019]|uniref:hypothetical protein n=1 Tax=Pedobacter sp. HMWF019 TaxID=2056856 RepID=UPI000D36C5C5|nr:hypothetical protein [Pedobacter sp. HMWF019]PTS93793.1 hypothetical protein DBR11_24590 [Pedobacter sp. HMWF019]